MGDEYNNMSISLFENFGLVDFQLNQLFSKNISALRIMLSMKIIYIYIFFSDDLEILFPSGNSYAP